MKKRIEYIDIAKAFAIINVVLFHTIVYSNHCQGITKLINSSIIATFFILSGTTFKIKENEKYCNFVKNKFIRIIIPYFFWALIFIIPYVILGKSVSSSLAANSNFNIKNILLYTLYGNGNNSHLKQNSALWFLPALFSMEVIYYYIIRIINKNENEKHKKSILLINILIGYISYKYLKIILPFGLNTVLNMGLFFLIGYLLRKDLDKILNQKWYISIICLLVGIICCYVNEPISCINYYYGNYFLFITSSLLISYFIISISKCINTNKILTYIGKNTIGILIFHKLVILIFQTKLGKITKLLKSSNIVVELTLALIIVAITTGISLLITEIIRKILPVLIGEKKLKQKDEIKLDAR